MNKDLLSQIITSICVTFGILTFVVQSHLPYLALFDREAKRTSLFFGNEQNRKETRRKSAKIVI